MIRLDISKEEEVITPRFREELTRNKVNFKNKDYENTYYFKTIDEVKKAIEIKRELLKEDALQLDPERVRDPKMIEELGVYPNDPNEDEELIKQIMKEIEEENDNKEKIMKIMKENIIEEKPKRKYTRQNAIKIKLEEERAIRLTFKERLNNNPVFRQERLDYLSELILCPICFKRITRSSLSYHRRSKYHLEAVEEDNNREMMKNITRMIEILKKEKIKEIVEN